MIFYEILLISIMPRQRCRVIPEYKVIKIKTTLSELSIYRNTEYKRSKILEHTIQDMEKRIN